LGRLASPRRGYLPSHSPIRDLCRPHGRGRVCL